MSVVNARNWVRQSGSPIIDGNYPLSTRPTASGRYFGYMPISVTSISAPDITLLDTPDEAPKAIIASASQVTCVGTRDLTTRPVSPYQDLHHQWQVRKQNGDPIEDLEGWADPRDGSAVNPYTDQVSSEFSCILREPGVYNLIHTIWGMTSSKSVVIERVVTKQITVLENSRNRVYYSASGNDANDGLDALGLSLSGATFDSSTRVLDGGAGSFSSYNHTDATAGVYTFRYNWIHITGFGWYEIEEKINNNSVRLVDGSGLPASGLSSSDGPKLTFDGVTIDNTIQYLRGGDAFTTSQPIRCNFRNDDCAIFGYGNAKATINGVTDLVNWGFSNNNTPGEFIGLGNLVLDGTDTQLCHRGTVGNLNNSLSGVFYFDDVDIINTNASIGMNFNLTSSNCNYHIFVMRGNIDNGSVGAAKQHAIFTRNDNGATRIVAITTDVRSNNTVLDHFIYPNGVLSYAHFAYINFRNAPIGTNYCINANSVTGLGIAEYISINNNFFSSDAFFGVDFSNASNVSSDGQFQDVVVQNNKCNASRGMAFYYSAINTAFRYNQDFGGFDFQSSIAENRGSGYDNTLFQGTVFRNQTYGRPCVFFQAGQDREIVENECFVNIDEETFRYSSAELDLRTNPQFIAKDNNLYAPNKTGATIIRDDGVDITLSAFNSSIYATGNTSNAPSWPDPANGDFGGLPAGEPVTVA